MGADKKSKKGQNLLPELGFEPPPCREQKKSVKFRLKSTSVPQRLMYVLEKVSAVLCNL